MADELDKTKRLRELARHFPESPGVYLMRNAEDRVIYVGKAVNLRARTLSYFSGVKEGKTRFLVRRVENLEAIDTSTEYEALVLENNLIKEYMPRYNIHLRDGKSYPVIRITAEAFPRVFKTRQIVRDGSEYFGPYPRVHSVDVYIDLLHKLLRLRRCKVLRKRDRPCLYYHIGQCSAPCAGKVSREEYSRDVRKARSLLKGQTVMFRSEISRVMKAYAAELEFEKAAGMRDALKALDVLEAQSNVTDFEEEARDYINFAASGRRVVVAMMQMRGGRMTGRELFVNEYLGKYEAVLDDFVVQYYSEPERELPAVVYLCSKPDDLTLQYFEQMRGGALAIRVPELKRDVAVMDMVKQNAGNELNRLSRQGKDGAALSRLREVMNLERLPRLIEGFDISHLHGKYTVASLISFVDGVPNRRGYRHYNIRSTAGGIDDFKAIGEVIARRYQRVLNEGGELPDLILVDGGRGQVAAAARILDSLGLVDDVVLAGLAKRNEEIWLMGRGEPVCLPEADSGLRLLQYVRDETHRFATVHNRKLRAKEISLSTLEGIPGIGPGRSARLIAKYKSLELIRDVKAEEIARTAGVGLEVAETVREFLGKAMSAKDSGRELRK